MSAPISHFHPKYFVSIESENASGGYTQTPPSLFFLGHPLTPPAVVSPPLHKTRPIWPLHDPLRPPPILLPAAAAVQAGGGVRGATGCPMAVHETPLPAGPPLEVAEPSDQGPYPTSQDNDLLGFLINGRLERTAKVRSSPRPEGPADFFALPPSAPIGALPAFAQTRARAAPPSPVRLIQTNDWSPKLFQFSSLVPCPGGRAACVVGLDLASGVAVCALLRGLPPSPTPGAHDRTDANASV